MGRIANPAFLRGEAVAIPWGEIAKAQTGVIDRRKERAGLVARLAWACAGELGAPHGAFTVWTRGAGREDPRDTDTTTEVAHDGTVRVDWRVAAGRVVLDCLVADPTRPVRVDLCWRDGRKEAITASASVSAVAGRARVDLRTSGATFARLTNGTDPSVTIVTLDEVANAADWEPLELVGLPATGPELPGADYDLADQGLLSDLQDPFKAAVDRLRRGSPPVGWYPVLPSGTAAPPWQAPDPERLVTQLAAELLPRLAPLYAPGLPEHAQAALTGPVGVDGPGRPAVIDAAPWPLLSVPALGDTYANLALGFGTAYPVGDEDQRIELPRDPEFLVTATYRSGPVFRAGGPGWKVEVPLPAGEYAAYAPPVRHAQTPAPAPYTASRYSLHAPAALDAPWRENVRATWPPLPAEAATVRTTQVAPVRAPIGAVEAEALFAFDAQTDGWRVPGIPAGAEGDTVHATVDPLTDIPPGSGGRRDVYAAALADVHGVWSPWSEDAYLGAEPGAAPPMLANLRLVSTFAGTPQCPASLDVEVLVEWHERSTTSIELSAVLYPMSTPAQPPPSGIGPESVPPGAFRHTCAIAFAGDAPMGVGCSVSPLDADGVPVGAAGPVQGDPRRYAVHVALPALDFGSAPRWGVDLWARREVAVGPTPTAWAPADPSRAMIATAGSPVPVVPSIVQLPGVPLASLPDADGLSHAKVVWSAPPASNVKTFAIWQASEVLLRERCGVPEPAPGVVPGARLLELRRLLVDHPEECRLAFRRVAEVPGDAREADIALARGARAIQVFVVTSTTTTGADSPWPYTTATADFTQVCIAPRVMRPAQPLARPAVTATGLRVDLAVASDVPVGRFLVYACQSFDAARRADSMGAPAPAVALAPADPPGPGETDGVTGQPVYRAGWEASLTPSWRPWYLRTVAEPDTSGVPEKGWRGLLSAASDIVTVSVPPAIPPDLDPLVVETVTADHTVLVARTSTAAPVADTDLGPHLVAGRTGAGVTPPDLDGAPPAALSSTPTADPSPYPSPGVAVVTRGAPVDGRTPLAVWFTRPDASSPVEVGLRLVDPLGRATVLTAHVAGWSAPVAPDLQLVAVTRVSPLASVITVTSRVDRLADPPFVLAVAAGRRLVVFPGPRDGAAAARLTASIALPQIRPDGGGGLPTRGIRFAYRKGVSRVTAYDVYVPLASPFSATVTLTSPEGAHSAVRASG
ncbi:hypothetical protein [Demequina iriomotensis]|uniref:hypothetical protein n=1 Tax=Demequina iriomotensis TaxID=1536641 RepID=UPI0007847294|nr:hypothetical protein [Demequina iriomotensis]